MGSASNANAEWIELYNSGASSISLDGWTLVASDGSPNIALSGVITASGFFLLERTSDDTVAGIAAGVVYAGSLSNSGETLLLKDADGAVVDSVAGGENWQAAGGDNVTKQTAQRTSSGWATAAPTPNSATVSFSSDAGTETDTGTTTSVSATSTANATGVTGSSYVMPPPPDLYADGGGDRTVIVGADTEFKARAYDAKKNTLDFVRFRWNFGDGSTADGSVISHRFEYVGRYVVALEVLGEKNAVSDEIIVTVEKVELALSLLPDGGVAIENRAGRTLDLSRWIVRSASRAFTIPERTLVLANASLRFSQRTLGFIADGDTVLEYPSGAVALRIPPAATTAPPVASPQQTVFSGRSPARSVVRLPVEESPASESEAEPAQEAEREVASSAQVAAAASSVFGRPNIWWLAVLALAALVMGALVVSRHFGKKEWDIEEMSETR